MVTNTVNMLWVVAFGATPHQSLTYQYVSLLLLAPSVQVSIQTRRQMISWWYFANCFDLTDSLKEPGHALGPQTPLGELLVESVFVIHGFRIVGSSAS